MLKISIAAVAATCIMATLGHALTLSEGTSKNAVPEAQKVHAGQQTFEQNCLQCHAIYAGQYSFGPNLAGEMKKPTPKKSAAEIRLILKNGKGKMPAFGDKLAPADTDNLLAYLHTL